MSASNDPPLAATSIDRWRTRLSAIFGVAFFVLLWLARFNPPILSTTFSLDDSWQQAYSYFHAQGFQAGVDYVFTYGPLAFLEVGQFANSEFWTRVLVYEFGFELAVAFVLVRALHGVAAPVDRILYAVTVLLAASVSESYACLAIVAITSSLIGSGHRGWPAVAAGLAIVAVLAWVKFPYAVLAVVCVLAIAIIWAVRRSRAAGCGVITVFAFALGLAWLAGGQSLVNLPAYLSTSILVTRGYPQGMSLPADARSLGFAVAGLALAGLWLALRGFGPRRSLEKTVLAIVLAIALFLGFKGSFVRFDGDSAFTLFLAASLFLLPDEIGAAPAGPRALGTRSIRLLRWACVACGLLGLQSVAEEGWRALPLEARRTVALWSGALGALGDLRGFAEAQQRETENQARAFDLPRTRAVIGSHPVDLFGVDQLMLLRNGLAYHPRPVFQTYSAYTPALMELNAQHLEGELAPSFVLMRLSPIDQHLAAMEDGLGLQTLLRDYRPLFSERGLRLWQRKPFDQRRAAKQRPVEIERTVRLGEWLDLGDLEPTCHVVRIDVRANRAGELRDLAYRPAPVFLEVITDAQSNRRSRVLRINPSAMRVDTIIDPLIEHDYDVARWIAGSGVARPRALRVVTYQDYLPFFEPDVHVVIRRADDLVPEPAPDGEERFMYPMFGIRPDRVVAARPLSSDVVFNEEVLVVFTPSELGFVVEAGAHTIRGAFGMAPQSVLGKPTDGAEFTIEVGGRGLLRRYLDPANVPGDRRIQRFQLEFETAGRAELLLETHPGPRNETRQDRAYWTQVTIDDLEKRRP